MILLGYLSVEEYPETETITISAHAATVCECVAVYLSVLNALWLRLQSAFIRFRMVFQSIHIAFRDSLAVIQHRPLRQQTKTIWFLQIVRNETMAHHSNVSFQWILNIYIHSRWTRFFFLFVCLALCFFPYFHILFLLQFFFFYFRVSIGATQKNTIDLPWRMNDVRSVKWGELNNWHVRMAIEGRFSMDRKLFYLFLYYVCFLFKIFRNHNGIKLCIHCDCYDS